tara:strand:- start:1289 stop:2869 length:1581 start_codon:yes stop_codon:yes gene_type:complete
MSQTQIVSAKTVSIVPQNGTEFDVTRGQKIIFEIDPSMGLIKGRDSYLALDVLNNSVDHQRLALDGTAGVDGLIARVDIYSLRTGKHLETMENYNQFMSLANQYFFEDKSNIQTLQGCGNKVFTQSHDGANMQPVEPNVNNVEDAILSPITSAGVPAYNFRRYITPLKCGVFRYWDDERLCPVMGFQGLRIELTLEDPRICCHNMNGLLADGTKIDLIEVDNGNGGLACDTVGGAATDTITTTGDCTVKDSGLVVGNKVTVYHGAAGTPGVPRAGVAAVIKSLTETAGKVVVEFTVAAIVPGSASDPTIILTSDTRALRIRPQFRLVQVAPTDMVIKEMSKGLNYSFTTYDYFVDSLIASVRKHLIELNSVATKAVCVMSTFSDGNELDNRLWSSYFAGEDANDLKMDSVQYFLKGRLAPVRSYDPRNNSEKIISQNELNKALQTLNVEPKDLGNTDGKNIENYTNCFAVARQLARRGYYYNLRESEGQIRLGFTGARDTNVITNTFVWSQKIVTVDPSGELNVIL